MRIKNLAAILSHYHDVRRPAKASIFILTYLTNVYASPFYGLLILLVYKMGTRLSTAFYTCGLCSQVWDEWKYIDWKPNICIL